jgi:hypothetical protein
MTLERVERYHHNDVSIRGRVPSAASFRYRRRIASANSNSCVLPFFVYANNFCQRSGGTNARIRRICAASFAFRSARMRLTISVKHRRFEFFENISQNRRESLSHCPSYISMISFIALILFSKDVAVAFYEPYTPPKIFFSLHTKASPGIPQPNMTPGLARFE